MENLPANAADLIVITVLLVSSLLAFSRGFVRELFSVGGWVGAIFATLYGFSYIKPYARQWISIDILADAAAGMTIFITTLITLTLISRVLSDQIRTLGAGSVDRSLGFLFGLLRGVIIVCLTYLLMAWILPKEEQPEWLCSALTIPLVEKGADQLLRLIPEGAVEIGDASHLRCENQRMLESLTRDENQRMLKSLTSPRPRGKTQNSKDGYSDTQRQDMDRLFETNDNP